MFTRGTTDQARLTMEDARACQDCGADISARHRRAYLCVDCSAKRKRNRLRKQSHNYWRAITKPLSRIEKSMSGQRWEDITTGVFYPHPFEKFPGGLVELPREKQLEFIERWERFFPEGTPQPRHKRCRSCQNDYWSFDPNPVRQFTREVLEVPDGICLECFTPKDWEPKLYTRADVQEPEPQEQLSPPVPDPPPSKPNPKPKKTPRLAFLETTSAMLGAEGDFGPQKTNCSYCYQGGASDKVFIFGEIQNLCPDCQDRHKEFIER